MGMDVLESAKRELREETGLRAERWTEIMKIHTSNSVSDEVGYVFLAEHLEEGIPDFDETEDIAIRKLPFANALTMVEKQEITDAISVAGILRLARMLAK